MAYVLVVAERADGGLRKPTLELLTLARRLGDPAAVVFGAAGDDLVARLGEYGATAVHVADDPAFDEFLVEPKLDVVAALVERLQPVAVLLTSGLEGKDLGGRLAMRLGSGIVTDAIDVRAGTTNTNGTHGTNGTGRVEADQSVVAGSWVATSTVVRGTPVITVRPNAIAPVAAPVTPTVEAVDVVVGDSARRARIVSRSPKASTGRPDLSDAAVVVSGGRGVGSAEGFEVVERVADALGGAVGASRAATDEKWYPHDNQIGQTGTTVAPQLYLAAGISGAIQHRAGMQGSRTIVAVNKDPNAPIFEIADFGVVGDLHTVLPTLVDEIERRRN